MDGLNRLRLSAVDAEHFRTAAGNSEVPEKDLMDMLTSLNEIVVSTDKEHKAFEKLSSARETACLSTKKSLQQSISEGSQSIKTAQVELSKAMSEVESIQGGVSELKSQVKTVEDEIAALQKQLATLRTERQAAIARDSGYTREVKAILSKAKQRIDQVWTRSGAHKVDDVAELLQGEVKDSSRSADEAWDPSALAEIHSSLTDEDAAGGTPDKTARTEAAEGSSKALAKDAADVNKAAQIAREAFELEELRLMDLLQAKRKLLGPLQEGLADRQPELADQLKKISEANRTVAMSKKGVQRDTAVLEKSDVRCDLLAKAKKFEADKRPEVREQVVMAVSFLKSIAKASDFTLTPGAEGPKTSPVNFLQLDSISRDGGEDLSEAVRNALHNIEALSESHRGLSEDLQASDDTVPAAPESNLVQVGAGTESGQAARETADSLKGVKEMISNLIASLREEQSQDKDKGKFCEEQEKKAREGFKKLSAATEDAEQAKRWAENAVLDLQAQARFLEADVSRLKQAVTSGKADLDAEVARIKEEAQNHAASKEVIVKSRAVLKTHCQLSGTEKSSGNCGEADAALNLANLGLEKLDKFLATYILDFTKVSEEQKADAEQTLKLQGESLFQANADLNRRKDELAELASDVVTAQENMRLAGKADDALSTTCGPKATSMEDAIARRKEEIEQLKNAVKVLDGEADGHQD
ncbi:SNF1 [Symbiodinium natans]|uniref:SNF1 protein n=1 Tax=Symbiodinium natans TaxID=878477 RepID=A0A812IHZ4_9DINO|nr:SNF1 [Symbiodinium natans]